MQLWAPKVVNAILGQIQVNVPKEQTVHFPRFIPLNYGIQARVKAKERARIEVGTQAKAKAEAKEVRIRAVPAGTPLLPRQRAVGHPDIIGKP